MPKIECNKKRRQRKDELSMRRLNISDYLEANCFTRSYRLDLPHTARFFVRGNRGVTTPEYGPFSRVVHCFEADLSSQDFLVAGDLSSSDFVLIGAVTAFRSVTNLILRREQGRFTSVTVCQPQIIECREPEEIVFLRGSDWRKLLIEYGDTVADKMSARRPDTSSNSVGYCSWYYDYHNVSEKDFQANLSALVRHKDEFPCRYVQIDDGYQTCQGDWLTRNDRWPTPLADAAKKIKDAGFEPGIWIMPFIAATSSRLYEAHPDWFVRKTSGEPVVVPGWSPKPDHEWVCLDATNPDVKSHIRMVFETMYGWGFRYFKLDGLGFSAPNAIRYDTGATGVSAYREGLRIVRESVKESVVLGVGPSLPSVGLVDHNRISTDTAIRWRMQNLPTEDDKDIDNSEPVDPSMPGLAHALWASLTSWWQYDRLYRCDPDVIIARHENTHLTAGEARMSALMAILTGVAFTSDRLDAMTPSRLRLLHIAASLRMHDAEPVDWQTRAWPNIYRGTVYGKPALAIFNFSERDATYNLSAFVADSVCTELLHEREIISGKITLPPHDAALLTWSG